MGSTFSFIDIIIIICGGYVLYVYYLLKMKGEIKESLLLPKDISAAKCKDKTAYIAEISPKVLIYGVAVVIFGILGLSESQWGLLGYNIYLVVLLAFAVATVWFARVSKKAVKKYW